MTARRQGMNHKYTDNIMRFTVVIYLSRLFAFTDDGYTSREAYHIAHIIIF